MSILQRTALDTNFQLNSSPIKHKTRMLNTCDYLISLPVAFKMKKKKLVQTDSQRPHPGYKMVSTIAFHIYYTDRNCPSSSIRVVEEGPVVFKKSKDTNAVNKVKEVLVELLIDKIA